MKWAVLGISLALAGCMQTQDPGVQAARMEAQDHATCQGRSDYQQCRQNLMGYRQQALAEEGMKQQRRRDVGAAFQAAGAAMQANEPRTVNVNVSCSYGRC